MKQKKFEYTFRNTPADYFLFRLGNTYHHWTAVVNIVFTAAIAALMISRWGTAGTFARILMVLALMIFPVFQPLSMYLVSIKESEKIREDTTVCFDETGMHITVREHRQTIRWKQFDSIIRRRSMLIAVPDGQHAYLLTNRILGEEKQALYEYVTAKSASK